jgi:hypothetical protein
MGNAIFGNEERGGFHGGTFHNSRTFVTLRSGELGQKT